MTPTHTPLPWFIDKTEDGYEIGTEDAVACQIPFWEGSYDDANLILTAVNNHEALVEALREAVEHIKTLEETIECATELGLTIAICGATYSESKARTLLAKIKRGVE